MKTGDLIEIRWADSFGTTCDWDSEDDLVLAPCYITTAGILVGHTDEYIAVAGSRNTEPHPAAGTQVTGVICIPRCCIKEIFRLTRKKL